MHATSVDLLHDHWRTRLVDGFRRALGENLSHDQAIQRLPSLSGPQLLALDLALRTRQWTDDHLPKPRKAALTETRGIRAVSAAYLFVAACDASGFVRERALEVSRHYPSRLAVSAALIRCDDWVPEVRSAAIRLLDDLIVAQSPAILAEHLDLLVRLRSRQRFGEAPWTSAIVRLLSSGDNRAQLWRWVREGSWDVRKFALDLIASGGPEARSEAIRQATHDRDFRVALWGLAQARADCEPFDDELLRDAARHPAAPVRAVVMRLALNVESTQALSIVNKGLLDLARGPRAAAAYALEHRFAQSPLDVWRAALLREKGRERLAALFGLCDRGAPEDVPLIAADAEHHIARVRAAVLEGLWRARARDLGPRLELALRDPAGLVVRRALDVYARSSEILDSGVLERVLSSDGASTTKSLIRGVRLLDRWEGLRLLLQVANSTDSERRSIALGEIRQWLNGVNRRFTAPPGAILEEIQIRFSTMRRAEDAREWRELANIIDHVVSA
jgi:hypothetical protein